MDWNDIINYLPQVEKCLTYAAFAVSVGVAGYTAYLIKHPEKMRKSDLEKKLD